MTQNENTVVELYGKDQNNRFEIEFFDLNHTGSADSRENQVMVLTVPESVGFSLQSTYQERSPRGIKDFEKIRNGDGTVSLYFGGSYGAKTLFASVGELLYYTDDL